MFSNPYADNARTMVRSQLQRRGVSDSKVLEAMVNVPRHLFMNDPLKAQHTQVASPHADAYADHPSPIGQGQTISQPFIVAIMTQWLNVQSGCRVLEIGTGSGYQTAVLMELGAEVWTVERSEELATRADKLMHLLLPAQDMRVNYFHIRVGDGTLGWEAGAPYDRIIVTAGAPKLPDAYLRQLAPKGRIVIPIGDRKEQQLMLYDERDGKLIQQKALPCRFVPLVGEDGWEPQETSITSEDHKLSYGPNHQLLQRPDSGLPNEP